MNIYEDFEASERRQRLGFEPILTDWALDRAALIDTHCPGFLRHLMKTKPVARHAAFAVLANSAAAALTHEGDQDPCLVGDDALGANLLTLSPAALIASCYGRCPNGLLGTFGRLREPVEPDCYLHLVQVFRDPAQRRRQQLLQYTREIGHDRLRAILTLDAALCVVRFARKVHREQDARIANDVVAVVRSHRPDLTDEAIVAFLSQGDEHSRFGDQLGRLLSLIADLPPLPMPVPDGFAHLRTRKQFEEVGRRLRNCVATKFESEALTGRAVYLEYLPRPALAVLLTTNRGWLLGRVHAAGNAAAPPGLVEEVRAALGAAGVPYITPAPVLGPLASVRFALMRHDLFGLGPDEFEGMIPEFD